ncbi:MAG: GntR family transcriptional regulator [Lysobacterales bacterium]
MDIVIDLEASSPPFAQLMEQIKTAVASGMLKPGAGLPSIRQLAGDLGLNSKTVAKAYRLLERDAVILCRGYRGTVVHPDGAANCSVDLSAQINQTLRESVAKLRDLGATDSELRIAFSNVMNEPKS